MDCELSFELEASDVSVALWAGLPNVPIAPTRPEQEQYLVLRHEAPGTNAAFHWLVNKRCGSEMEHCQQIQFAPAPAGFSSLLSFSEKRCLIPATSCTIYREGEPYSFSPANGSIFAIGAVCLQTIDSKWEETEYFSVISVPANPLLASLFGEHPLIIDRLDYHAWLYPSLEMSAPRHLVKALTAPQLKHWQLGPRFARA